MELSEILRQPEGFTPPEVTVKIEKVYERKSGESSNGPWSFQDLQVTGGRLKLKGLPEFPKAREGMTVTLKANSSKQHGLTGMKVNHEQYQGKIYDKLVITSSCKWEWAEPSRNGHSTPQGNGHAPRETRIEHDSMDGYIDHLMSVAALSNQITTVLGINEPAAMQACFATLCIDTKNRGILLPKSLPKVVESELEEVEPSDWTAPDPPEFADEDIPF